METRVFEKSDYVVRMPENFREGEKYPPVIFLHGAGARGRSGGESRKSKFTVRHHQFIYKTKRARIEVFSPFTPALSSYLSF